MIRIVHIITGLGSGGAENMLYKLLKYSNQDQYHHEVISLMDKGIYGDKIEELGIKVHCLNLNRKNIVSSLLRARRVVDGFDIVDTWLYHADFFGFIVAKIMSRKKLVWNIRHSNLDKNANKWLTLRIVRVNTYLSRYVDVITYNSYKAKENHLQIGYTGKRTSVIPNGFELDRFRFSPSERDSIRNELGLTDEKVIITVGRWDVQKDYYTLMAALHILQKKHANFKMVMVGENLDWDNKELVDLIKKSDLESKIFLLGRRVDIPALLSAADIYVSSSLGESFSNSIGEAMACELSCVVTDVGHSKIIVGDTGVVIEAGDYGDLSDMLLKHVEADGVVRCKAARERIALRYDIRSTVGRFEKIWGYM